MSKLSGGRGFGAGKLQPLIDKFVHKSCAKFSIICRGSQGRSSCKVNVPEGLLCGFGA